MQSFGKPVLNQDTTYSVGSEKFLKLKEDIKIRGVRDPIIIRRKKHNRLIIFQGGHRFLAAKQLGYKDVPCKII